MKIKHLVKDTNWQNRVESVGYGYHSDNGIPYWVDDYYFSISPLFADEIYNATTELWQMCLAAVEHVIENKKYHLFHIPNYVHHHIERSWNNETPSIYGRFDFAYDEIKKQLKLLEFNADTPTSLFECGVVQWHWKQNYFGDSKDQFNSVHEQLIQTWKEIKPYLKGETLHFTCVRESLEDLTNVEYLRDCAMQAGIQTQLLYIDEIGWNGSNFVDLNDQPITDIFKLYPWEWMINEEYGHHITNDILESQWIEPSWKMILSNKAILAILWELYPNHPLLLETYFNDSKGMSNFVKKPLLSREGANISVVSNNRIIESTQGDYGHEGFIYQELASLIKNNSGYSIIGSWIIGQESCGISFRESDSLITNDRSRFIPHIIE